jgi:hypothetical protein
VCAVSTDTDRARLAGRRGMADTSRGGRRRVANVNVVAPVDVVRARGKAHADIVVTAVISVKRSGSDGGVVIALSIALHTASHGVNTHGHVIRPLAAPQSLHPKRAVPIVVIIYECVLTEGGVGVAGGKSQQRSRAHGRVEVARSDVRQSAFFTIDHIFSREQWLFRHGASRSGDSCRSGGSGCSLQSRRASRAGRSRLPRRTGGASPADRASGACWSRRSGGTARRLLLCGRSKLWCHGGEQKEQGEQLRQLWVHNRVLAAKAMLARR